MAVRTLGNLHFKSKTIRSPRVNFTTQRGESQSSNRTKYLGERSVFAMARCHKARAKHIYNTRVSTANLIADTHLQLHPNWRLFAHSVREVL